MNSATERHAPQDLPIDLIASGPFQARRHFDSQALDELASSIAESGVVQPVVVRSTGSGYQLLAGERRWRAAQRAGLTTIPALVRDDLSQREAAILGLVENLQRESLTPTESARGLKALGEQFGLTHEHIARRIGKSRVYVTNYLRLLQLAPAVLEFLDAQKLSLGHGKILAGLPLEAQETMARQVVRRGLSVRGLERLVSRRQSHAPGGAKTANADLREIESRISEALGNRVRLSYDSDARSGQMVIDFHDLDEFEGILSRLDIHLD